MWQKNHTMTDAPKRSRKPDAPVGAQVLSEHELTGLFAEAFEAYDMMDERVRFDSLHRRWVFVVVKPEQQSELLLKLQRGKDVLEEFIPTPILATALGRPKIEEVVRALDGAVA